MYTDSLLLHAPRTLAWVRTELTPPGPGEVWLEDARRSCQRRDGRDRSTGATRVRPEARPYPLMTGYESLARVTLPSALAITRREKRRPALSPLTATAPPPASRADTLMRVPEGVPDEIALLAILSNDASKGVGKLRLKREDAVLITGAGTIGLLTLHRLRWLGFAVDMVEPSASRPRFGDRLSARVRFLRPTTCQLNEATLPG